MLKLIRTGCFCLLLMLVVSGFTGCATASHDSALNSPVDSHDRIDWTPKSKPATADMNPIEKTGYFFGWISLNVLYAFAASNLGYSVSP